MSSHLRLYSLFATLVPSLSVSLAVACGGTATSGTSPDASIDGSTGPRDPVFDTLTESLCLSENEHMFGIPIDANLATGVDYIGGYAMQASDGPGGVTFDPTPKVSTGEACKTAPDKAACQAALVKDGGTDGGASGWSSCEGFCDYRMLQARVTRGGNVDVVTSSKKAVIPSFLPVDTAAEALVVAGTRGCSGKDVVREASGTYLVHTKTNGCSQGPNGSGSIDWEEERVVRVAPDGTVTVVATHRVETPSQGCAIAGRRPEGLVSPSGNASDHEDACAAYLAKMAHLEAASVVAFDDMIRELRAHGAPEDLVRRAEEAKNDEVRHARVMTQLAEGAGASVPAVDVPSERGIRSLLAIAKENMAEGCVRETFGALVAHRQASVAQSTAMRLVMRSIARDETKHAALSWDLHAWLVSRLSPAERTLVAKVFEEASCALIDACSAEEAQGARALLGLPDADESRTLAASLVRGLAAEVAA